MALAKPRYRVQPWMVESGIYPRSGQAVVNPAPPSTGSLDDATLDKVQDILDRFYPDPEPFEYDMPMTDEEKRFSRWQEADEYAKEQGIGIDPYVTEEELAKKAKRKRLLGAFIGDLGENIITGFRQRQAVKHGYPVPQYNQGKWFDRYLVGEQRRADLERVEDKEAMARTLREQEINRERLDQARTRRQSAVAGMLPSLMKRPDKTAAELGAEEYEKEAGRRRAAKEYPDPPKQFRPTDFQIKLDALQSNPEWAKMSDQERFDTIREIIGTEAAGATEEGFIMKLLPSMVQLYDFEDAIPMLRQLYRSMNPGDPQAPPPLAHDMGGPAAQAAAAGSVFGTAGPPEQGPMGPTDPQAMAPQPDLQMETRMNNYRRYVEMDPTRKEDIRRDFYDQFGFDPETGSTDPPR